MLLATTEELRDTNRFACGSISCAADALTSFPCANNAIIMRAYLHAVENGSNGLRCKLQAREPERVQK